MLRFAEMLNPDGTIYTTNLRTARCRDTYILEGEGEEVWQPRFTFHGFRYVEVTAIPASPTRTPSPASPSNSAIPLVGRSSAPARWSTGSIRTSSGRSGRTTFRCPPIARNATSGWAGRATPQDFVRAATYNADVAAFFTKWLVDLEDAQGPDGAFPDVAPRYWDQRAAARRPGPTPA